jgi:hypothetical protein
VSLICFTFAIVSSTVLQWVVLSSLQPEPPERLWQMLLFPIMWLCFIGGLGLAVAFGLINLFTL